MNLEQFQQLLLQKQKEIEQALRRTLPVKGTTQQNYTAEPHSQLYTLHSTL